MLKSNGPSIEPWGTSVVIGSCPDLTQFISTYCDLFVKLYRLCHNVLIVEVKLCDQVYRMLSRDLKIY